MRAAHRKIGNDGFVHRAWGCYPSGVTFLTRVKIQVCMRPMQVFRRFWQAAMLLIGPKRERLEGLPDGSRDVWCVGVLHIHKGIGLPEWVERRGSVGMPDWVEWTGSVGAE